jgi:hypothetical protein
MPRKAKAEVDLVQCISAVITPELELWDVPYGCDEISA